MRVIRSTLRTLPRVAGCSALAVAERGGRAYRWHSVVALVFTQTHVPKHCNPECDAVILVLYFLLPLLQR